jgi:hypothetical protein
MWFLRRRFLNIVLRKHYVKTVFLVMAPPCPRGHDFAKLNSGLCEEALYKFEFFWPSGS